MSKGYKYHNLTYSAIYAVCFIGCSQFQVRANSDTNPAINGWKVTQLSYSCEFIKIDTNDMSEVFHLRWPFRGNATFRFIEKPERDGSLTIENKTGVIKFENGPSVSVQVNYPVGINIDMLSSLQQRAVAVELKSSELQKVGEALRITTKVRIQVGRKDFEVDLPSPDLWYQGEQCLVKVGEALSAEAPPANADGSLPNRDLPIQRRRFSVTGDDYPPDAMKIKAQGRVAVSLTVDRYGYAIACRIVKTSGFDILDEATCAVLQRRTRFYPALDSAGKATQGNWETRVNWALP